MSKQPVTKDGLCGSKPSGPFSAILLLAYDLYLIRHHQKLQELVISRLKDPNQFQGAKFELFALSSCIRAGFDIEFEDETNRESKHAEFTAINKDTNDKISIEAKSKHRSGVLGYKIEKGFDEKIKTKVVTLINYARKKKSDLPLVIFVDTNLPEVFAEKIFNDGEMKEFKRILDRVPKQENDKDDFNLIIFTNTPHYYKEHELIDSKKHFTFVFSMNPISKVSDIRILDNLNRAVSLDGNVPNEFPDYDNTF